MGIYQLKLLKIQLLAEIGETEYAERLQLHGITVEPVSPVIEPSKQRKPVWKRVYDAELDSIPEEYRLPTAGLEELKERVISAMEVAGYAFNKIETDYGCLRFNGEGGQVIFGGWKEAATWLENVFVDDPELSDKVSAALHPNGPEEMTVLVVEPKKEPYVKTIPSGLESLQHEVGGDIEAVYPFEDPVALIVNEEGKIEGLPLNRGLYDDEGRLYDITSGTMLVVGLGEDNFSSLSPDLLKKYEAVYQQPEIFIRINKEMRTLDLKKNLESKVELCEKAESLLLNDSINQSFRDLQALHEQWKEIGPVPEEKKEEIWERFKAASDQINQRRKDYYDKLFAEEQNNYNAKVVLCEQAEEIVAQNANSVKDYNEISDKLTELLNMWKTLGPAPAKLNDEIWNRFKSTLDKFFGQKKEYFQQIKDSQMQNYNQKLNLAIQAEGIADRTDWKEATNDILKLQTEWKSIGATPRKYSDQIWKRFRAACDKFFEAKANYFNNIQDIEAENLKKKEELIQKILTHEFSDDRNANMEVIKQYQNEWLEIGFVPKKEKDRIYTEYRAALDKRFAELKISANDLRNNRFRNKIDNILNNPNADKIIDKEKNFLKNKLQKLKEDIILWENNLGFFSNSKNAEIITAEFRKKIESAKEEIKDLEYKIRMMDAPKKEESAEAPETDENPQA